MLRERVRRTMAGHEPLELELGELRPAGVLLLLHEIGGVDHVVFQQRTDRVRHHKGEISLPGGARDPEDGDLLETALRETHEEIGVAPAEIEVLGQLDDVETHTGYLVRPYVGAARGDQPLTFVEASREVRELLHVPMDYLLSEESHGWTVVDRDGEPEAMPAYLWEGRPIWGVTARVLGGFLSQLGTEGWGR